MGSPNPLTTRPWPSHSLSPGWLAHTQSQALGSPLASPCQAGHEHSDPHQPGVPRGQPRPASNTAPPLGQVPLTSPSLGVKEPLNQPARSQHSARRQGVLVLQFLGTKTADRKACDMPLRTRAGEDRCLQTCTADLREEPGAQGLLRPLTLR